MKSFSRPSTMSRAVSSASLSSDSSYLSLEKPLAEEFLRRPFSPEARAHSARSSRASSKTATPARSMANLGHASASSSRSGSTSSSGQNKDVFANLTLRQRMRMVLDLTMGCSLNESMPRK